MIVPATIYECCQFYQVALSFLLTVGSFKLLHSIMPPVML